jgi:hypothetical protein
MELWFACKLLASSLCVEARLLTQFTAASRGVFHLLPVDSAVGGTKYLRSSWKSDVLVLHLKVASLIRVCEACEVMISFSMICLPGAVQTPGSENIVPAISPLPRQLPTRPCVSVHPRGAPPTGAAQVGVVPRRRRCSSSSRRESISR